MSNTPHREPTVSVHEDRSLSGPVVAGLSEFGLAGLTTVDYLTKQLALDVVGHVSTDGLPSITPFAEGVPRHPTRLHGGEDVPITTLVGEQFVPAWATETVGASLLEWIDGSGVDELCFLRGVPLEHGPEAHQTYWIASQDFRERRLEDADLQPMGSGFLDGVPATLLERGMDTDLAVGVLVTPVHQQTPDPEAALRLLEAVGDIYGVDVDERPLEAFAEEVRSYYGDLAERLEEAEERDRPEDRMYM